jgi:aminopeptidase N
MQTSIILLLSLVASTIPLNVTPINTNVTIKQLELNYRLNTDVLPVHYDILVQPHFEDVNLALQFTIDGKVIILLQPTHSNVLAITLHAHLLQISDDWIIYAENNPSLLIPHGAHSYEDATHKLTLPLSERLKADIRYVVEINYTGVLADDMMGFYKSYYYENGEKK